MMQRRHSHWPIELNIALSSEVLRIQRAMKILPSLRLIGLVLAALVGISWVITFSEYGSGTSVGALVKFLEAAAKKLLFPGALLPSLYLTFVSLFVLTVVSTFSAWLQVVHGRFLWKRFDLLLFFPSIIPVYVYGVSIEDITGSTRSIMFVLLPLIIVMGNGLWWWWHRQFVTTIRQLQSDKPSIGISNMGLGATRYYVLPEFRRTVWQKMPEMFLWVLVNTLFLEAAIPKVSGILYNLVLSLSDGERSVEWNGVMVAVSFIGLTWLIVRLISDYRLIRPVSYSGWGFIQGGLIGHGQVHGWLRHEHLIQFLASVPLIFVFVIFYRASTTVSPYWELVVLMFLVTFVVYVFVVIKSYRLAEATGVTGGRKGSFRTTGLILVVMLVLGGGIASKLLFDADWGVVASNSSSATEEQEDMGFEDTDEQSDGENDSVSVVSGSLWNTAKLFFTFWIFSVPAVLLYLISLLLIFLFFFTAHYRWKGSRWNWWLYRSVSEGFDALSRVPPYLLLVVTVFWLGFQTYDGCTKQFVWIAALFFALLPTQLLSIGAWIDEASRVRFLVARRSVGISTVETFTYLLKTRWFAGLVGLIAFALGLILLMDISMIWLLDGRGTFTCDATHWLDHLRREGVPAYQAILMWIGYPIIMFVFVQGVRIRESLTLGSSLGSN